MTTTLMTQTRSCLTSTKLQNLVNTFIYHAYINKNFKYFVWKCAFSSLVNPRFFLSHLHHTRNLCHMEVFICLALLFLFKFFFLVFLKSIHCTSRPFMYIQKNNEENKTNDFKNEIMLKMSFMCYVIFFSSSVKFNESMFNVCDKTNE